MVVGPGVSPSATPAMCASTPAIFQAGLPPWAVQTPEVSPMLWERAPRGGQRQQGTEDGASTNDNFSQAGGPSKDLLRKVCEPFFEQMLVALQEVLSQQSQNQQSPYNVGDPYTMTMEEEAFGSCFQHSAQHVVQEESDGSEAGEGEAAFSSFMPPQESAPQLSAPAKKQAPANGVNNDGEKAASPTVMVCRHWKSKGWCRLGADCKFSHPDHKCGVGSANANKGNNPAAVAAPAATDMHAVAQGLASIGQGNSSDDAAAGGGAGAKRSGRNRKGKAGNAQPSELDSLRARQPAPDKPK